VLIENYDLELFTPPCHPGAETWSAVARLEDAFSIGHFSSHIEL
jgi:hypothetical protein